MNNLDGLRELNPDELVSNGDIVFHRGERLGGINHLYHGKKYEIFLQYFGGGGYRVFRFCNKTPRRIPCNPAFSEESPLP